MTCSWFQCRPAGACLLLLMTRLAGVLGKCLDHFVIVVRC